MNLVINPGSGPVTGTTEGNAVENIKHFIVDCDVPGLSWVRVPTHDDGGGRFAFLIYRGTRCHLVEMPGLLLDQVRFMGEPQNIWDFPRLYVDGGSWVWKFAILENSDFEEPENE